MHSAAGCAAWSSTPSSTGDGLGVGDAARVGEGLGRRVGEGLGLGVEAARFGDGEGLGATAGPLTRKVVDDCSTLLALQAVAVI